MLCQYKFTQNNFIIKTFSILDFLKKKIIFLKKDLRNHLLNSGYLLYANNTTSLITQLLPRFLLSLAFVHFCPHPLLNVLMHV